MEKDIRFVEKKVDESWKEQANRDRGVRDETKPSPEASAEKPAKENVTSKSFLNLLSSLAYQAMMHLGDSPEGAPGEGEVNLEAAKEIIDLLGDIKQKTEGNRSAEESQILDAILPELQMKFTSKA